MAATYTPFTKKEFEQALPVDKITRYPLWVNRGLVAGEYEYGIAVKPTKNVIVVRSTVGQNGESAPAGGDSIRVSLLGEDGQPVASKLNAHIKRTQNWAEQLRHQLKTYYTFGLMIGVCSCGKTQFVGRVKDGINKGRYFRGCRARCPEAFKWVELPGRAA